MAPSAQDGPTVSHALAHPPQPGIIDLTRSPEELAAASTAATAHWLGPDISLASAIRAERPSDSHVVSLPLLLGTSPSC